MKKGEFNRATIGVVSSMDMRGRATACEIKRGLQTEKKGCFRGITGSAILGYVMAVALLVALLAPLPASADEGGIPAEIAALKTQVAALQKQVATLQKQLAAVQSNEALTLGPFVSVVSGVVDGVNGPHIYFTGANIHIVSGSGSTNDNGNPRGLGNLIIGYDENPGTYVDQSPLQNLPLGPLAPGDRGGSHNLVIGAANRFTLNAFSGLVVGTANTIQAYGTSVTAGAGNVAPDYGSSVSGGFSNTAGSFYASISGGTSNSTGGPYSSISGGLGNTAGSNCGGTCGWATSVTGGTGNFAIGNYSCITGGSGNQTVDIDTTITGGTDNTAGSQVTFQGGIGSIVVGGSNNNAGGRNSVVLGGQKIDENTDDSIAPNPPFP